MIAETEFKNLFLKEYDKLCRYAYTYLDDTHLADDVVQETFIKIWEQKRALIETPEIKFYLAISVRNNCISYLRKQKGQKTQFSENMPEAGDEQVLSQRQFAEEDAERKEKLATALAQLPPKCKDVFLLVKMQGLSYKQVAAALDISVKTVENQMGKAIRIFREMAARQVVFIILAFAMKIIGGIGVLFNMYVF